VVGGKLCLYQVKEYCYLIYTIAYRVFEQTLEFDNYNPK